MVIQFLFYIHIIRWVGFEHPGYVGEQYVLEKGEYPRWSTWTNCQKSYNLSSFRPVKVVSIITVTDMRRCDFLSDIPKCFSFACRIVQNTSCICSRMKAMKEERWRLLMTMSPVCGLMVSRTVWPVLRLSMERKKQNYYYIFFHS